MKFKFFNDAAGHLAGYTFMCPGCNEIHQINTRWIFNGDLNSPTVSPSILVTWDQGIERTYMRCHSFIRDGRIQFLDDCTHDLKGKTVELPNRT
jgi:hypothetical protein